MLHLGDITKISGYDAPVVDCIIGGSPCQDLSVAGKRAGLAGERSGLFMEQIRIVKEMRACGGTNDAVRPRYMVWENVPGAFSSNGGKDFAAVLEETIRVIEPEAPAVPVPEKGWPTSGCFMGDKWSVAWRVLDAQFWGVPQRRRRIVLIADFGGHSAPEICFVRKSLSGNLEPGEPKGKETAGGAGGGIAESSIYDARVNGNGAVASTMTGDHNGRVTDYTSILLDDQSGNQISVREDGKAPTLRAETHGNLPCVFGIGNGQTNQSCTEGIAGALNCMHDQQAVFCLDIAHTLKAKANLDFREDSETYVVAGLDCRNGKGNGDLCGTLQSKPNGGFSLNRIHPVRVNHAVRRLTPLECERLQGYPDGWTDIGEWVDSKGKLHKPADSPRYKAMGNSIAIPPWKWLLKRLCACYERDATMASLFDGIGGFPYIWEQLNGKGSCIWASEIEEFPMAVTKVRFP